MYPVCESLSSVWADQNHWWEWLKTHPASESLFSVFEQMRTAEHMSSLWVSLCVWADQNHWPEWVWMAEHAFQDVSHSPVFKQIGTTGENGWTHAQGLLYVSCFPQIWARTTNENGWTCVQDVSCCSVFEWNHWREWLNICPACEYLYSVWADQNHWQQWLNTHPATWSESVFWAN